MPINLRCPQGHLLAVAEKYAGRRIRCPKCQAALAVPGANGSTGSTLKPPPLPKPERIAEPPPIASPPVAVAPAAIPPVAGVVAPAIVERRTDVRGYRADRARAHTVYWLALGLMGLVFFQLAPVFSRLNPATAPDWARWVMMLALVQVAFAAWMASLPDWSTVRVMMFALAGVATLYCVALGIAVITPPTKPLWLEMDDVRDQARLWCAAVLLLVSLMIYISGRIGFRWKKAFWNAELGTRNPELLSRR